MNGIFISYRREDAAGHAGRLFDRLAAHFGRGSVFMDVEGIEAGVDFVDTIEKAVGGCDVLLAIIGRGWLDSRDSQGNRRLDAPQDFIRLETSAALARNVRVIPVLVEGAKMPRTEDLPENLRPITRRQAMELRDTRWEDDIQALIAVLDRVLAPTDTGGRDGKDTGTNIPPWVWKSGAAALLLAVVLLGIVLLGDRREESVPVAKLPAPAVAVPRPVAGGEPGAPVLQAAPVPVAAPEPEIKPASEIKPAPEKAAIAKPAIAEPAARAALADVAAVRPAPARVGPPAPQPRPKLVLADEAPVAPPAAQRKIAIIALGEPTFRDFWEGERRAAYSAKIAGLYRDALSEAASRQVELSIANDTARDLRGLDKSLRDAPSLCGATRAEAVFVARVEEAQAISRVDSAYWPELRLTAIACDSGRQYTARDNLSPRRDDGFPFEGGMADTMERFAREYRHLLQ